LKLPFLEQAFVEAQKITAYLLSEENSGGKSAFFIAFGFSLARPEELQKALLVHAVAHEVTQVSETPHGIKYIIDGKMQTPDGRSPQVRSVWIVDAGKEAPRLVTAYPLEGERK
jgi:hypothetical protein